MTTGDFAQWLSLQGRGAALTSADLPAPTEFGRAIKGSIYSYLYLCFSLFVSHPVSINFCFENIENQN